jgi:cytochrome c peroxidase
MKTKICLTLAFVAFGLVAKGAENNPLVLAKAAKPNPALPAGKIAQLRKMARELIGPLPDRMPGAEKDTAAQIKLGEKLFFEKRLSSNNSISCNSCHVVDKKRGGVDNEPTSPGAFGKRGDRNSPTVLNAGFQFAQFWDGRAPSLEDQAKGPVLNPVEMAMPHEKAVLERISADPQYRRLFAQAYPEAKEPITYDNVAGAIAAFERTLITRDRFDDFQKGDDQALRPVELKGLETFLTIGCTTCHNSPSMGGNSYQKVGLVNPYENKEDLGRSKITKDEDDQFKFKVPMLRNIALTHPYFHDGRQKTLEDVVQKMGWMQLGVKLDPDQTASLVAFLHTLTDKKRVAKN